MVRILFQPDNKTVNTRQENTLLEALHTADIHVIASCGGEQMCGECRVRILRHVPDYEPVEESFFTDDELKDGWRLACCHRVQDGMEVHVPDETRIKTEKVTSSSLDTRLLLNPMIYKTVIEIIPDSLKEERSIEDYIIRRTNYIGIERIPLTLLGRISEISSTKKHTAAVIHTDTRILDVETECQDKPLYGIAIDIGTTTIAGLLIDLSTGDTVAMQTEVNRQSAFGADVMSRINYAISNNDGLCKLSDAVRGTLSTIVKELTRKARIRPEDIYRAAIVGNTAMLQLFMGISPLNLAFSPYLPVTFHAQTVPADRTELGINRNGEAQLLPVISGFVGADIVGVIISSGMEKNERFTAAIDLGTNGEIVVAKNGRLIAAATAAGPAFEGAVLSCGMPALKGAVSAFRITDSACSFTTIGAAEPSGICGSGLIDIIAELLKYGVITAQGKMTGEDESGNVLLPHLRERLKKEGTVFSFTIWENGSKRIYLSQQDVREFQLAKGAIRAGISVLSNMFDEREDDLDEILVAGTFGSFVRKESVIRTGMLPGIPLSRISMVGNAACIGAKRVLLNHDELERAESIAEKAEALNLAARSDFQDSFMNSILFPDQAVLPIISE